MIAFKYKTGKREIVKLKIKLILTLHLYLGKLNVVTLHFIIHFPKLQRFSLQMLTNIVYWSPWLQMVGILHWKKILSIPF